MEKDIIINYGKSPKNRNGKEVTHMITSIDFDNKNHTINLTIQRGGKIDYAVITIEFAQHIGFLNIEALEVLLKKNMINFT